VEVKRAAVQRWEGVQSTYRDHLETISLTLHPFHLHDASPQTSAQVHSRLHTEVAAIETLAQDHQFPVRHDLLTKVQTETDLAKRKQAVTDLQTFMADNLPYIFLWYPQEIDVINANLQGKNIQYVIPRQTMLIELPIAVLKDSKNTDSVNKFIRGASTPCIGISATPDPLGTVAAWRRPSACMSTLVSSPAIRRVRIPEITLSISGVIAHGFETAKPIR